MRGSVLKLRRHSLLWSPVSPETPQPAGVQKSRREMYQQPAASGARYAGRNSWLWEHHGEAPVGWDWQGKEEVCRAQP